MALFKTPFGWFTFHPPLQALSVVLVAFGILSLQASIGSGAPSFRTKMIDRHATCMIAGAFISLVGVTSVFFNKVVYGKSHFQTPHGSLGLAVFISILAQTAWGLWMSRGRPTVRRRQYHRIFGYAVFVALVGTSYIGGALSAWSAKTGADFLLTMGFTVPYLVTLLAIGLGITYSKLWPLQ